MTAHVNHHQDGGFKEIGKSLTKNSNTGGPLYRPKQNYRCITTGKHIYHPETNCHVILLPDQMVKNDNDEITCRKCGEFRVFWGWDDCSAPSKKQFGAVTRFLNHEEKCGKLKGEDVKRREKTGTISNDDNHTKVTT